MTPFLSICFRQARERPKGSHLFDIQARANKLQRTMETKKKTQPRYLQFSFLPYISLKDDLKIGNILLWPFYKKKDNYITGQLIKAQMQRFLKQYVEYVNNSRRQEPLENITMVSYKSPNNFNPLITRQLREVRDMVTMLCFSTIIRKKSWCAFSSDDFQLIHQNFLPGNQGIAPSAGSFIRRTAGGLKIEEVLFITPFYISRGWDIDFDKKILRALEKLWQEKRNQEFYRRIITSLEWVAYAYTNVDNFNYASRIVMMATSFEILLNGFRNRWEFMKKIKKYTCNLDDKDSKNRETRTIETNKGPKEKECSFKEWWAYEFYDLRSRIVHGHEIKDTDIRNRKGKEYFLLSIKFFEECLKKVLQAHKCYLYDFLEQMVWSRIRDEI